MNQVVDLSLATLFDAEAAMIEAEAMADSGIKKRQALNAVRMQAAHCKRLAAKAIRDQVACACAAEEPAK